MPIIQQERGVKSVKGLPIRWGLRAYRELMAAKDGWEIGKDGSFPLLPERYQNLSNLLDEVTSGPLPLDATDAQLCMLAETYAKDCGSAGMPKAADTFDAATDTIISVSAPEITEPKALRERMAAICRVRHIEPPKCKDDMEAIKRCTDAAWWRRNIRKVFGRAMEAAAIRLGFVSIRAGAYASDETVTRRSGQVERNKAALKSVRMVNELGTEYGLDELAAKGTGNKRIRRGELMLRLAGCEDVATERGDVGVFITITAPSKYHAVLAKTGTVNPTYADATPRQVQEYLQKIWGRMRAAYGRYGIKPYGFRIAEPHHDGCVHWHVLLFMRPVEVEWFCYVVENYALAEDGDEPGAQAQRVKFEMIDASKGGAAAYIAKYISKNIDDDDDNHDEVVDENGNVVKMAVQLASARVDAWAGVWGIRQFQPIGQPPVTVWREVRRVPEGEVEGAPEHIRQAWDAAQRVYAAADEDGACALLHAASFGDYIRAQGGVALGRDYAIGLAMKPARIEGRYGVYEGMAPLGVYSKLADIGPQQVHESLRFEWTRKPAVAVALRRSWSPVNNCTDPVWFATSDCVFSEVARARVGELVAEFDDAWFQSDEYQKIFVPPCVVEAELIEAVRASYANEELLGR